MQITTVNRFSPYQKQAPNPSHGSPEPPGDRPDRAVLTGQIAGGVVGGAGLGYAGMLAGLHLGMESGMQALGSHPLAQILGVFTVGLARAMVGAAVGGALGVAAGAGAGAYVGGKIGAKLAD